MSGCQPDFRAQTNEILSEEDREKAFFDILEEGTANGCTRFRCTTRDEPHGFLIEGWKVWPGDDYLADPVFDLQEAP